MFMGLCNLRRKYRVCDHLQANAKCENNQYFGLMEILGEIYLFTGTPIRDIVGLFPIYIIASDGAFVLVH